MYRMITEVENTQAERMRARIAELDATHGIEASRLRVLLTAAQSKYPYPGRKRKGREECI